MPLDHVSSGDPHVTAHNQERDAINSNTTEIAKRLTKPAGPHLGDLLRFDGTNWVSSVTRLFEGNGIPEGNVAAPIGSRYVDTTAVRGAVEWLKISGLPTDKTGWLILAGDTGWRDISNLFDRRGTAVIYTAVIRRVNSVVDMFMDLETPNNPATPWVLTTLAAGFRPAFIRLGVLQDNNEAASLSTSVQPDGTVSFPFFNKNKRDRWNGCWTTSNPWPTTLPGQPM